MHLSLATNLHVFLAKEALGESLNQLHLATNEDLIKACQLAIGPLGLSSSNAVFASGAGLSASAKALKIEAAFQHPSTAQSELKNAGIDYDEIDRHVADLGELLDIIIHSSLQGNNGPGTQSVRNWFRDNYKLEEISKFKPGGKSPSLTCISSSYATGAKVQEGDFSILNLRDDSVAFANEIYCSIKDCKEKFYYSGTADPLRQMNVDWETEVRQWADPKFREDDQLLHHPWIAGLNTFALCHNAAIMSCQMAVNKHILTAMLHSYDAARHLKSLPEIAVLEKLCNDLESSVFRQARPSSRFGNCFYRLIGSRIETKTDPWSAAAVYRDIRLTRGEPEPVTLPSSRTYNLAIPKRVIVRPTPMDISLTHACCSNFGPAALTKEHWSRIEKHLAKKELPPYTEHKTETSARMMKYRQAIEPEFSGELPVAGINYYALLSACESVLRKAGEYHVKNLPGDPHTTVMDKGWLIAHMFIVGADEATLPASVTQLHNVSLLEPMLEEFKGMCCSVQKLYTSLYPYTSFLAF